MFLIINLLVIRYAVLTESSSPPEVRLRVKEVIHIYDNLSEPTVAHF